MEKLSPKAQAIVDDVTGKLARHFGRSLEDASGLQIYKACAMNVRDAIMQKWVHSSDRFEALGLKKLYYLSVEFLVGRALRNNIINIKLQSEYSEAMAALGHPLDEVCEEEDDPGLGNGGLGRLAACFLDSLATLRLPSMGCGIRYEYGLFKQKIVDGYQVELPDSWLDEGNVWEVMDPDGEVEVRFNGQVEEEWAGDRLIVAHKDYYTVLAVPYDMPIIGYDSDETSTLRLWSAKSPKRIDMESFGRGQYMRAMEERELAEVISKVLYPGDTHNEGKELRLKQHYFFTSATIQYIVKEFRKTGLPLSRLPERVCIQINDTHPALAIPELFRILLDSEGFTWDEAWNVTRRVFSYTNHTVMTEALERWPVQIFKPLLPRIYSLLEAINDTYCKKLWSFYPGQWEKISYMAVIGYNELRMAYLSIALSNKVNGVSQLHADILKHGLFRNFYVVEPWKFIGITNGITPRRWLLSANPGLTSLIEETIGDGFKTDLWKLEHLVPYTKDKAFLEKFAKVKRENKVRLSNWLMAKQGVAVDPDFIFDVQAKRLHEYKRQLLNILHVICLYDRLLHDPTFDMHPQTFIFGAKASPSYYMAKQHIQLIVSVGEKIAATPRVRDKLQVVFLENYNVSAAEVLIPAAEISEQISTAGKEASGTGNMKFMMNGAITIGTLDGANVEMRREVGDENIFIFGLTAEETEKYYKFGYNSGQVFGENAELRKALDYLLSGEFSGGNERTYSDIHKSLLFGIHGAHADPYLVLQDFSEYKKTQEKLQELYKDHLAWQRIAAMNTAKSGMFSSDRTIRDYNDMVWHLESPR